jgi:hypothetical protein
MASFQWGTSLGALQDKHCIYYRLTEVGKYAFGAPKICNFFKCTRQHKNLWQVDSKNAFHIWAVTNHKSQICDCDTQTQMRYGNASIIL